MQEATKQDHDRFLGRVHAQVSASRPAQGLRAYPALRSPGQSLPIAVHRFVPETPGDGATGPVIGKCATKSIMAMPAVSSSTDRHPETDRRSTILEVLIQQLRRLVIAGFPFQPSDVLSHADADVCLLTRIRRFSMPAVPLARRTDILKRHTSPSAVAFLSNHAARPAITSTRIPVLSP